jgi:flagellar basal-body rod protein FlgG
VIANNMANVNTTAFKKDRCNFEDVFYRQYRLPGAEDIDGNRTSTGIEVGLGSRVSSTQTNIEQGSFEATNNQLDLAIEGDGYFQLQNPDGGFFFTRAGNFGLNEQGQIVIGSAINGYLLDPTISIPQEATNIVVSTDGRVQYTTSTDPNLQDAGNIQLVKFINPQGLMKLGDNLYQQTDASGDPQLNQPGTQGYGSVRQGYLEASNVEPVTELIDLITTQRAFELNSQIVQAGDQILQLVANLRRLG